MRISDWSSDVCSSDLGEFHYVCDGVQQAARCARDGNLIWLDADGATRCYRDITWVAAETTAVGSDGRLLAHSDGKIVAVHVQPGDVVSKGQTLLVLEEMKMEFQQIGRASCREEMCQYFEISGVDVSLKKKTIINVNVV